MRYLLNLLCRMYSVQENQSFSCAVFLVYSSVGVPNRHFRTLSTVYGKYISLRTGPVNHTEDEAALIDSIESSLCLQFIIEV